jgi:hypothetical protein
MTDTQERATQLFDPRATLGIEAEVVKRAHGKGAWDAGVRIIPWAEWMEEGKRLFGPNRQNWNFRCPACGRSQNALDFIKNHIDPRGRVFMTCIGRFMPVSEDPWAVKCRFTLEGLIRFPRVVVLFGEGDKELEIPVFEYAVPKIVSPFDLFDR